MTYGVLSLSTDFQVHNVSKYMSASRTSMWVNMHLHPNSKLLFDIPLYQSTIVYLIAGHLDIVSNFTV